MTINIVNMSILESEYAKKVNTVSVQTFKLTGRFLRKFGFPIVCSINIDSMEDKISWAAKLLLHVADILPEKLTQEKITPSLDSILFEDSEHLVKSGLLELHLATKNLSPELPVNIDHHDKGSVFFLVPKEYWLAKILFAQKVFFEVRVKSFPSEDIAEIELINNHVFGKHFKDIYSLNVKTGETDLINEEDSSVFAFSDKKYANAFIANNVIKHSSPSVPLGICEKDDTAIETHIKTIQDDNVEYAKINDLHVGNVIYGVPQNIPLSRKVNGMTAFSKTAHEAIKEYGLMIIRPLTVLSLDGATQIAKLSLNHQGKSVTFDVDTKTGRSTGFRPLREANLNFGSFFYFEDPEHVIKYSQREELLNIAEPYLKNRLVCRAMTNQDIIDFLKIFDKII